MMGISYGHSAAVAGLRDEPLTPSSGRNRAIAERSRRPERGSQHDVLRCAEVMCGGVDNDSRGLGEKLADVS